MAIFGSKFTLWETAPPFLLQKRGGSQLLWKPTPPQISLPAASVMADIGGKEPAKVQTRTATTRKHLRRDQEVSRKSKSKVVAVDSIKERQVS